MPLELIPFDRVRRVLSPGDKGFLICMSKIKWNKHAGGEGIKLLKSFANAYYAEKCPELQPVAAADSKGSADSKPASSKPGSSPSGSSVIQFAFRDLVYTNCSFIASNLEDPADYAYFIMTQLAVDKKLPKTRYPFRIIPVQTVCEARPSSVEEAIIPLIQKTLGQGEDKPYRFSLIYRGNSDGENLNQHEAKFLVRNCVWAVNPYCVQCIKYQDYAIMMDILAPCFCIGIVRDYQRLGGYNTWTIRGGMDLTDQRDDSEDEISDDSTLDEDEERRRKLKIKRQRRIEKGLPPFGPTGSESKKAADEVAGQDQEVEMQDENEATEELHEHTEELTEETEPLSEVTEELPEVDDEMENGP